MNTLNRFAIWIFLGLCIFGGHLAQGQVQGKITFKELPTQSLYLRKILILPAHDTMQGIYAGALQKTLKEQIENDHRFDLVDQEFSSVKPASEWSKDPAQLDQLIKTAGADGAIALGLTRRGEELQIGLYLYHGSDDKLLLQEEILVPAESSHGDLRAKLPNLYRSMMAKLPYDAEIMSRNQDQVTINVGARDKVRVGDRFLAIQIVQMKRHPHFEFLMETEQEAIGSVEVLKVADRMSFAKVVSEISPMMISESTKLLKTQAQVVGSATGKTIRAEDEIVFGESPREWKPEPLPSFGVLRAGLSIYRSRGKTNLTTAGSQDTGSQLSPGVGVGLDAWMTAKWTVSLNMDQNISSFSNPNGSGTPTDMSATLSRYNISFLRRVFPSVHMTDPTFEIGAGYSKWRWSVDSSTPLTFTNWDVSGLFLQARGQLPLEFWRNVYLGGDFKLHLWPSMKESPVTSASESKNSLTELTMFGRYSMTTNWWLEGALDLGLYSGRLSGKGSSADPSKGITYNLGGLKASVLYLF